VEPARRCWRWLTASRTRCRRTSGSGSSRNR
jgi:hypothetical protein